MEALTIADYTVVIRPEEGRYVAYLPAILQCIAEGDTEADARRDLAEVFELMAEHYRDHGLPMPADVGELVASASEVV